MDADKLRERCERFRVLVIGKANAGKTTILQKMCGTTENPIIHNSKGAEITLDVTAGRGIHDIEDELTFPNNPGFVFHDSCGFESGSTEEVDNVNAFIAARAASNSLAEQVHVVWICLPTDNSRPLQRAEMAFFEHGTGNVPAIAIFTKFDGLDLVHFGILRDDGKSRSEARLEAPKLADAYFEDHHLKRIQATKYPPARYVCLRNMHKAETECSELTRKTIEALDNEALQHLFASVQDNNIQVSVEYAITDAIRSGWYVIDQGVLTNERATQLGLRILTWFPHLMEFIIGGGYIDTNEDVHNTYAERGRIFGYGFRIFFYGGGDDVQSRWEAPLKAVVELLAGPSPEAHQWLRLTAAISIIGEHSFQLLRDSKASDALQGLDSYMKSPQAEIVRQAVGDAFPGSWWKQEDDEDISRRLLRIVLANLLRLYLHFLISRHGDLTSLSAKD